MRGLLPLLAWLAGQVESSCVYRTSSECQAEYGWPCGGCNTYWQTRCPGRSRSSCLSTTNGQCNGQTAYVCKWLTEAPTTSPTAEPTSGPSVPPSMSPSSTPTRAPTPSPSATPTQAPTAFPTAPTRSPSRPPTATPSVHPTGHPSLNPTVPPSAAPSAAPSARPTAAPSRSPTVPPSAAPTTPPTGLPTVGPTANPSATPSTHPTGHPSPNPTQSPSATPSTHPTGHPSPNPTQQPSATPSTHPTGHPSPNPTAQPSATPSTHPTGHPSPNPTAQPSATPSTHPTGHPSPHPSTHPTGHPTGHPTTQPSAAPSTHPTGHPSPNPTAQPSQHPSRRPSAMPTASPTPPPSTMPSGVPTLSPTSRPSGSPSASPTVAPEGRPTAAPSSVASVKPSAAPAAVPHSPAPTAGPSRVPTGGPRTAVGPTGAPHGTGPPATSALTPTQSPEKKTDIGTDSEVSELAALPAISSPGLASHFIVVVGYGCSAISGDAIPVLLHPTQLQLGGSSSRGCVLGNAVLITAVLLVHLLVARIVSCACGYCNVKAEGKVKFPGLLAPVVLILLQGQALAATRLVSTDIGLWGVAGTMTHVVILAGLYKLYRFLRKVPREAAVVSETLATSACMAFITGRFKWETTANYVVERCGTFFQNYKYTKTQHYLLGLCHSLLVAVISASPLPCCVSTALTAFVSLMYGMILVVERPYLRSRNCFLMPFAVVCTALVSVWQSARLLGAGTWTLILVSVSIWLSMSSMLMKAVLDLVTLLGETAEDMLKKSNEKEEEMQAIAATTSTCTSTAQAPLQPETPLLAGMDGGNTTSEESTDQKRGPRKVRQLPPLTLPPAPTEPDSPKRKDRNSPRRRAQTTGRVSPQLSPRPASAELGSPDSSPTRDRRRGKHFCRLSSDMHRPSTPQYSPLAPPAVLSPLRCGSPTGGAHMVRPRGNSKARVLSNQRPRRRGATLTQLRPSGLEQLDQLDKQDADPERKLSATMAEEAERLAGETGVQNRGVVVTAVQVLPASPNSSRPSSPAALALPAPSPAASPRSGSPAALALPAPTLEVPQRPRSPARMPSPTPEQRPRSPARRPSPTPEQRPRSPARRPSPTPEQRPRSPARRPSPTREVSPPGTPQAGVRRRHKSVGSSADGGVGDGWSPRRKSVHSDARRLSDTQAVCAPSPQKRPDA
eukprot:TRINITY_DN8368_c0_g1_i3.p1 TRINITY_DN8368_c0_g1~~TRINITY_DN8368_c0_g1_i3.p1  ORF type:complete len:1175 (+),score=183.53 TRINITY_DN8368_c0_g1_i3:54-3578(+)